MGNSLKMGRNPLERPKKNRKNHMEPTVTGLEKIKEMKIQIDWQEFYQTLFKDIKKFLPVVLMGVLSQGCSSVQPASSDNIDLKKQILEIQKVQGKQSAQIEELNNKILLLSDRIENHDKATPKPSARVTVPNIKIEEVSGDKKLYEMALRDLKNQSFDQLEKKVDIMVKGYKDSPLTSNLLFLEGESLFKRKQFGAAARVFEKLYGNSPDGNRAVSALYYLGISYEKLGRIQEAKEAFQSIINIYPGSREASQASKKLQGA